MSVVEWFWIFGVVLFVTFMVFLTVKLCRWMAPDADDDLWIGQ